MVVQGCIICTGIGWHTAEKRRIGCLGGGADTSAVARRHIGGLGGGADASAVWVPVPWRGCI